MPVLFAPHSYLVSASTSAIVFLTVSILIGFARCLFIPASSDACTSSANALAVIAMIGIVFPSGRSSSDLMALVASYPFISGIIMSIRITSKLPFGLFLKVSTAAFPSATRTTWIPISSSRVMAISAFRSLSSARRICVPFRSYCAESASSFLTATFSARRRGIFTVNVEPTPFVL